MCWSKKFDRSVLISTSKRIDEIDISYIVSKHRKKNIVWAANAALSDSLEVLAHERFAQPA